MDRRERTRIILELLGHYGRRVRFVGSAFGTAVSRSESHILIELKQHPGTFAAELADRLQLEQSSVSRAVANLKKRRLVLTRVSEEDGRVVQLYLSKSGVRVLQEVNKAANASLQDFTAAMSQRQIDRLGSHLGKLANAIKAPTLVNTGEALNILLQIRRITRPMGALGEYFFQTNYSLHHWHTMAVLHSPLSIRTLSARLSLSHNATSELVKRYERAGYLSRVTNPVDQRSRLISRTSKGAASLDEIISAANEIFGPYLETLGQETFNDFCSLLAILAGAQLSAVGATLEQKFKVSRLHTEQERAPLRQFIIEGFLKKGLLDTLPSRIADEEHLCYRFDVSDRLHGYCELRPLDSMKWQVHLLETRQLTPEFQEAFIAEVALQFLKLHPDCSLVISSSIDSERIFARAFHKSTSKQCQVKSQDILKRVQHST